MYIYKTINLINGKFYIGKSEKPIHESENYYGSGINLKRAISKYGIQNFTKEILDTASSIEELNSKEKYWISKTDAKVLGYNIADGGDGGNTGGFKPETVQMKRRIGDDGLNDYQRQLKKIWENRDPSETKKLVEKANQTKSRVLENGLTVAQQSAKQAIETKKSTFIDGLNLHEIATLKIKAFWAQKSEDELNAFRTMRSEKAKQQFASESQEVKQKRSAKASNQFQNTVTAFNLKTQEYKRIPKNEFNENMIWVGATTRHFFVVVLPNDEKRIVARAEEIKQLANELGVKTDWITRRDNMENPYTTNIKKTRHLIGTTILKVSVENYNNFQ